METQRDYVIEMLKDMIERLKNGAYIEKEQVQRLLWISGRMRIGRFEDENADNQWLQHCREKYGVSSDKDIEK